MTHPTRNEILVAIAESIARLTEHSAEGIREDQHLIEDLGLDSLGIYELVVDLEERFGMKISNEDAEGLATVGEATDYVYSRLQEA